MRERSFSSDWGGRQHNDPYFQPALPLTLIAWCWGPAGSRALSLTTDAWRKGRACLPKKIGPAIVATSLWETGVVAQLTAANLALFPLDMDHIRLSDLLNNDYGSNFGGFVSPTQMRFVHFPLSFTDFFGSGFTFGSDGAMIGGTIFQIEATRRSIDFHIYSENPFFELIAEIPAAQFYNWAINGQDEQAKSTIFAADDSITGTFHADVLRGYSGSDTLTGRGGNDLIDGGSGMDTAVYTGHASQYRFLSFGGSIVVAGGVDGIDLLQQVEQVAFTNVTLSAFPSALNYIASYGDLINAFGVDGQAGLDHFRFAGYDEGRQVTFDSLDYIASYSDLMNVFGASETNGSLHFIQYGSREGRPTTFSGLEYVASHGDLMNAVGANDDAGAAHFIQYGRFEGRQTTFDGLEYIASYGDLINAFHVNEDSGAAHFIQYGRFEGRSVQFDPASYLANYADLQAAFGSDLEAATVHFITYGYGEGRHW